MRFFYLCRVVDPYGGVLDSMVQKRRNKRMAKRVLAKLAKQGGQPRVPFRACLCDLTISGRVIH
ncbi:MAG: DDE-type integrase/transposase/recombinase [Geminicoccaceae bacterium]